MMALIVQKLRIKSVNYTEGEAAPDQGNTNLSISCFDSIAIKGSSENWTSFYYTRTLDVVPVSVFSLSVVIFAIVGKESPKEPAPTEQEILAELRHNGSSVSSICAEASLLVSMVTKENGGFPMITPPIFLEKVVRKQQKESQ
jgi:hypothetical protein